ncbi:DUF4417 domain-containing protein [Lacticaseibacillus hegangensis]|uniref:DUF4417 domain-containing protein n=1 Tax=Lacticaseibacillus hegangensis TaxID=2486010 RepID=A0ABW4CUX1_9LACO|nr:DUF4417 domain-containing protein [Lacticaseibacillus hegangensis]
MQTEDFFRRQPSCKVINGELAIIYQKDYLQVPMIQKQAVDLSNFQYLGFQNLRSLDVRSPQQKTVGYFLHDSKFECVCKRPWRYTDRIRQYKQTLSPDVSCYADMTMDEQWYGVVLNRAVGAYWQEQGIRVIPTIAWGKSDSYKFCFSGVEQGSVVAVSTIGTAHSHSDFVDGFREMCRRIKPSTVICYCTPYPEMYKYASIIVVEHEGVKAKRAAKVRSLPGQLSLFDLPIEQKEAV